MNRDTVRKKHLQIMRQEKSTLKLLQYFLVSINTKITERYLRGIISLIIEK